MWSLPDGKCIKTLIGHDDRSYSISLVISPDGKILASGSICSNVVTIKLWSLPDGKCVKTLTDSPRYSAPLSKLSLAITPDGRVLFSASSNDTLNSWSLPDGNHIKTIGLPQSGNGGLVISPNGEILAFHSLTGLSNSFSKCNIFSEMLSNIEKMLPVSSPRIITTFAENKFKKFSTDQVYSLVVSPDSQILISSCGTYQRSGTRSATMSLALSADGKILASRSSDCGIYLWRVPDDKELLDIAARSGIGFKHPPEEYHGISLMNLRDGEYLGTLTSKNNSFMSLISPESQMLEFESMKTNGILLGNEVSSGSLAISPNGRILVSGHNKNICLWNLPKNISVSKLSTKDVDEIEAMMKQPNLEKGYFHVLKFTLFLIRLRQQFDIDIEDSFSDVQFSEFDIEIDG